MHTSPRPSLSMGRLLHWLLQPQMLCSLSVLRRNRALGLEYYAHRLPRPWSLSLHSKVFSCFVLSYVSSPHRCLSSTAKCGRRFSSHRVPNSLHCTHRAIRHCPKFVLLLINFTTLKPSHFIRPFSCSSSARFSTVDCVLERNDSGKLHQLPHAPQKPTLCQPLQRRHSREHPPVHGRISPRVVYPTSTSAHSKGWSLLPAQKEDSNVNGLTLLLYPLSFFFRTNSMIVCSSFTNPVYDLLFCVDNTISEQPLRREMKTPAL